MANLVLTERSQEIADKIPKQYRLLVLNAIIARSISNGSLVNELSLYLGKDEILNIANELDFNLTFKSNERKIEKKKMRPKEKKEEDSPFFGFDK